MATRITCDVQDGDRQWMMEFEKDLEHLCGAVEEAFETNRVILLSQTLRELIRDHGRKVSHKIGQVKGRIVVDNPNKKNLFGIEP